MAKKQDTKVNPSLVIGDSALPNIADLSFEAAYRELEQLVVQIEQGDLPLERTLELHTRGQQLSAHCAKQLDQAELRITTHQPQMTN